MGLLRRLREAYKQWDLRFPEPVDEKDFKSSLANELVNRLFVFFCVAAILALVAFIPQLMDEVRREDMPLNFLSPSHSIDGPRFLYFASALLILGSNSVIMLLCLLRRSGRCKLLDFEKIAVLGGCILTVGAVFGNLWVSAQACGFHPDSVWNRSAEWQATEFLAILTVVCTVNLLNHSMPIRTHVCWIVSLTCAVVFPLTYAVLTVPSSVSTNASLRINALVVSLCAFSHWGARSREAQQRMKWKATREASERDCVARGLVSMSSLPCEVVIRLDSLGVIVQSDCSHESFFGASVKGRYFSELIREDDRVLFERMLQKTRDTKEMQSMPVSIELPFALLLAHIAIVDVSGAETTFLLGVTQVEHEPTAESIVGFGPIQEEFGSEAAHMQPPFSEAGRVNNEGSMLSFGTSTATEHVFADIDRLAASPAVADAGGASGPSGSSTLRQVLGHIAEIGAREHWLVGTAEVELLPQVLLGQGGFGVVVLGRLRGTPVAVKVPHKHSLRNSAVGIASLCNELRLIRRIRHPQIVAFYGAAIDHSSGELAMIYEFVEGSDMCSFLRDAYKGPRPPEPLMLLRLLLDIAGALVHMHSLTPAIVHGDIKMTNIKVEALAGGGGRAKLLDFGLSRLMTLRSAKPLGGTKCWMAPELLAAQGLRQSHPSRSVDVYSFGLLVHSALTGHSEDASFDHADVRGRSKRLTWPRSMALRTECESLCVELLQDEPNRRPTMATTLSRLLQWLTVLNANFAELGRGIIGLCASSSTWDVGLRSIRDGDPTASGAIHDPKRSHAQPPSSLDGFSAVSFGEVETSAAEVSECEQQVSSHSLAL